MLVLSTDSWNRVLSEGSSCSASRYFVFPVMEREGSLPLSQELTIVPHPETNELVPYFKTRNFKVFLRCGIPVVLIQCIKSG